MSGSLVVVYKKKNYKIYDAGKEYNVHNTKMCFTDHHTHIKNFDTCKYIINLSIHHTVPKHLSDYLLVSLLRISDDESYKEEIRKMLNKSNKKYEKARKKNERQKQDYRSYKYGIYS